MAPKYKTGSECSVEEQSRLTSDEAEEDSPKNVFENLEAPPPPDGGYGWVVVFSSFMCNMILDGIAYTFGVFLGEFARHFNAGQGTTAWVGSLLSGVYLSCGPIVSALTNKYGCRRVCIAGSFIGATAFVLSTYSNSITMLMLTYGVMGGIGFGMVYLPAIVCVGYYFETKRSLATGIAVCGSGFGTFAFAPLANMLLETYSWQGANLILAGLILNCAVFGSLMKPLKYPKSTTGKPLLQRMAEEKRLQLERGSQMEMSVNVDPGVHSSLHLDQLVLAPTGSTLPTIEEVQVPEESPIPRNTSHPAFNSHGLPRNDSVPYFDRMNKTSMSEKYKSENKNSRTNLSSNGDVSINLRLSASSIMGSRSNYTHLDDGCVVNFSGSKSSIPKEDTVEIPPLSRKDIFYHGSITNLREYQSQKSLANYRQSITSLPKSVHDELEHKNPKSSCLPESFKEAFGNMLDMSLLKNPVFLFIGISNVFGMAGLYVPFVYLVDAAVLKGIEANSASFLISIIGITNTIGRVVCGYIADFPQVNSLLMNNICLLMTTITVAATPFCQSYASYVVMSIFFGIAISGYISLTSIILVDLLSLEKLTNAFGLLILFRGAATIVGSPLAGAVYDATGTYSIPFYMAGIFFLMSTLTSFMAPAMKRCIKSKT